MHHFVKAPLAIISAVACGACVAATNAFVQGRTTIIPPVTRLGTEPATHLEKITLFNDGGTRMFTIRDAAGKQFDVYLDHRLDSPTPGAIYLYAYPGREGSVRVVDQRGFERKTGIRE